MTLNALSTFSQPLDMPVDELDDSGDLINDDLDDTI